MAKRKLTKGVKRKDFMGNNSVMKYIIIPCMLVMIASCIYLIVFINNKNSTLSNIEYIRSFMSSSGQLRDYSNKIGMHDPAKDIKWYKTNKEVRIEFGRIFLTWEPDEFFKQDNLDRIATIGFTVEYVKSKSGYEEMKLYYQGVEVERWVK